MSVTLTINGQTTQGTIGPSLFDFAETAGVQVPTSCVKNGKCKECIVEIAEGIELLSPPTSMRHTSKEISACRANAN